MKSKFFLLCILFGLHKGIHAQNTDLRKYLSNIVELGADEFGLIIGGNSNELYFITATTQEKTPNYDNLYFYKTSGGASASFVKRFSFDKCYVNLFIVKTQQPITWKNYAYSSLFASSKFYSYLNNGKTDSMWYINSSLIGINDRISNDVLQLKVPREDNFYQGFPLVNDNNEIVGIVAEKQENDATTFLAVDMASIQKKIYEYSDCHYFNLVKAGEAGTPCEIASKIKMQNEVEQARVESNNRLYGIASGSAFSTFVSFGSKFGTFGLSAGYNIFLSPDKGKVKFTLKPRLAYVPFKLAADSNNLSTSIGYQTKKTRFFNAEIPLMLEIVLKRVNSSAQTYLGFGYVPCYQTSLRYLYNTADKSSLSKQTQSSAAGYKSKVQVEFGAFNGNTALTFFVSYQLTPWHDATYYTTIQNELIYPTHSYGDHYTQLGFELSFRSKGEWGLKTSNPL